MSTSLSIRLPDDLAKELDHLADETERTRSFHVQKAIEAYMEDFADLRVALDRLRDPRDEFVSGKDLRKSLGL